MTTKISKNLIVDNFVALTGDTMTGTLVLQADTSGSNILLQTRTGEDDTQNCSFGVTTSTGSDRMYLTSNPSNDQAYWAYINNASQWKSVNLESDGNLSIATATAPTDVSHATRKDYVDSHVIQKNHVFNPTFIINQRGYAGGVLASQDYGFDRWKARGAGSVTHTLSGIVVTINDGGFMEQIIEDFGYTGDVTLSWEGTATAEINTIDVGTFTSPYTTTVGAGDISIAFNGAGGKTVSKIKLEIGSVATPFEYPDEVTELAKCQRYYWRGGPAGRNGGHYYGAAGDTQMSAGVTTFPVTMRDTPTVTQISAGGTVNCTYVDIIQNATGFHVRVTVTASGKYRYLDGVYDADAEL